MQRPWVVVAGVGALAVIGAGIGIATQLGDDGHASRVTAAPSATPSTPIPSPTAPATNPGVPEPTQYPEPNDQPQSVDLSWVGVDDGFALVGSNCNAERCTTRLLVTRDGGRTWQDRHARGLPTCRTCQVRFANRRVGYAFTPFESGLVMTTDGGRTWSRQPGWETHGLEIAHGTVVRVVTRGGCPGCTFRVQRSLVGSSTWHTVYASRQLFVAADLTRQGEDIAVNLEQNAAGGAADAHSTLVISHDGGSTWTTRKDPCGGSPPDSEADAQQLTWSQDGILLVLCQPRITGPTGSTLLTSADGGRTFGTARGFGSRTHADVIAAGRGVVLAQVWQADAQGRIKTRPGHGPEVALERSTDGGRTWAEVSRAAMPEGEQSGYLAFSTSRVVTWVPPAGTRIRRSTDAGRTWSTYRLA